MGEVVDGQYQKYAVEDGAYIREHFFGNYPRAARDGQAPVGRAAEAAAARRPRSGEGLRRLQGGGRAQGPADGDPGQDDQGLRPRRSGRRQEHHAPAEEAQRGGAARCSARASAFRSPTRRSPTRRSTGRPDDSPEMQYLRERRKALGGYVPIAQRARRAAEARRSRRCSRSSTRAPTAARPRPRWSSCGCCRSCCATRRSAS